MSKWFLKLIGLRECDICGLWHFPVPMFGNICSEECMKKKYKNGKKK